ncbi:hypothetical protein SAMD00019534_125120 [Acytostelium subglobosum LB1]|uniref:hypothetical protein n=1 Tax=Acytostelium subglobosum LB1 TaxID=1410327 RepID=UPI0006448BDA|nr:hypothetical protein SAMD00019534_125120 [Acytostelium subglobosum LB1]GAM29336.1 hypothetical protein SAMD00019534_125120 [Acytostelium subglobosum LB1]|eukprot:XP_012747716.1 hypothetical protein SAMD00019534_125120 [Acytostelium subglobosum LB1]
MSSVCDTPFLLQPQSSSSKLYSTASPYTSVLDTQHFNEVNALSLINSIRCIYHDFPIQLHTADILGLHYRKCISFDPVDAGDATAAYTFLSDYYMSCIATVDCGHTISDILLMEALRTQLFEIDTLRQVILMLIYQITAMQEVLDIRHDDLHIQNIAVNFSRRATKLLSISFNGISHTFLLKNAPSVTIIDWGIYSHTYTYGVNLAARGDQSSAFSNGPHNQRLLSRSSLDIGSNSATLCRPIGILCRMKGDYDGPVPKTCLLQRLIDHVGPKNSTYGQQVSFLKEILLMRTLTAQGIFFSNNKIFTSSSSNNNIYYAKSTHYNHPLIHKFKADQPTVARSDIICRLQHAYSYYYASFNMNQLSPLRETPDIHTDIPLLSPIQPYIHSIDEGDGGDGEEDTHTHHNGDNKKWPSWITRVDQQWISNAKKTTKDIALKDILTALQSHTNREAACIEIATKATLDSVTVPTKLQTKFSEKWSAHNVLSSLSNPHRYPDSPPTSSYPHMPSRIIDTPTPSSPSPLTPFHSESAQTQQVTGDGCDHYGYIYDDLGSPGLYVNVSQDERVTLFCKGNIGPNTIVTSYYTQLETEYLSEHTHVPAMDILAHVYGDVVRRKHLKPLPVPYVGVGNQANISSHHFNCKLLPKSLLTHNMSSLIMSHTSLGYFNSVYDKQTLYLVSTASIPANTEIVIKER